MRQPKDFQRNSPPSQAACEASFSTSNSKAWSTGPSYVWLPFPLAMFDYRRVWNNQYWYPPKLPRCIEQRRAKDPHIAIQFRVVVHSTETHHTDLLILRGPDLQWKAQDVANAWNLDIDGFREDVAACRDLQDVLMGAGFFFNLGHISSLFATFWSKHVEIWNWNL